MPMLVALNGQTPLDLPVPSCTWRHSSTKQDGTATVVVPYRSAAYTSSHIDEKRAFPVLLLSRLGRWDGICLKVRGSSAGVVLDCVSLTRLLSTKVTTREREFENLTAGRIMKAVLSQTFANLAGPGLNLGTFAVLPPAINRYTIGDQPVNQIASELQDATGQELSISGWTFSWLPSVATTYGTLLVEGSTLTAPERTIEHDDVNAQVIGRTEIGQEAVQRAADVTGVWQREQVFTSEGATERIRTLEATAELRATRLPRTSLSVGLRDTGSHWANLREGMAIECLVPTVGFAKQHAVWRVLSRTYTEGSPILGLELWHLPKPEISALARIGAEIPPVVRRSNTDIFNQVHELIRIREPFSIQNPAFTTL